MIHPEVEQVILRALSKEPENRFASIPAFANALEQAGKFSRWPNGVILYLHNSPKGYEEIRKNDDFRVYFQVERLLEPL